MQNKTIISGPFPHAANGHKFDNRTVGGTPKHSLKAS